MPTLEFHLTEKALEAMPSPAWEARFGAVITFHGVVRGLEDGAPIKGIEYSAYPSMVQPQAELIAAEATALFPPHQASIVHRTGFVAVAEPSVLLQVASAHSGDAQQICGWYLAEMKRTVPIWKDFIPLPDAP